MTGLDLVSLIQPRRCPSSLSSYLKVPNRNNSENSGNCHNSDNSDTNDNSDNSDNGDN